MNIKFAVIAGVVTAVILIAVQFVPGCSPTVSLSPNVTGDNITRASTRNEIVQGELKKAEPISGKAKPHVELSREQMKLQEGELKTAKDSNLKDRQEVDRLNNAYTDLNARWYVSVGRWLTGFWHILIGVLILGLVLRIASMFVGGAPGTVLAAVSTGIFGVMSGGLVWIQSAFDNIWHRTQKHKLNSPTPEVDPATAN